MASIADLLGVQWEGNTPAPQNFTLSKHAKTKGFDHAQMLAAAHDPGHSYTNPLDSTQEVRVHKDHSIAVVVDPKARRVITAYKNVEKTELRPDQVARGVKIGRGAHGGVR